MYARKRQTCRVCGSQALTDVIDLGEQYLQTAFWKTDVNASKRRIPLVLARCNPMQDENACGLLQARHSVPPAVLYQQRYWYRSSVNATMRTHLKALADEVSSRVGDAAAPRVLDIGCNDGTLLAAYPATFEKWGVDPSEAADSVDESTVRLVRDFFPTADIPTDVQFDAITAIAMFYDLEDPVAFTRAVRARLKPGGVFVFEMSYMPAMLAMNAYDTICNEHLTYYSLAVVERICQQAGLHVVDVSVNSIYGGSLRCTAMHEAGAEQPSVAAMRAGEFERALETGAPYAQLQTFANTHKGELHKLITGLHAEGKRIHVYGASTKGNTLLQWCGLDKTTIEAAADREPLKWGAVTPGSEIPIISEEESRARRPDYYLVLPWQYQAEFVKREAATLAAGTQFIFPLPEIKVVGA